MYSMHYNIDLNILVPTQVSYHGKLDILANASTPCKTISPIT